MATILASVFDAGSSKDWLITANVILSVLLTLWMLRYRRLYLSARREQTYNSTLIENLSEGIYRSLPDGRVVSANAAMVGLNGYGSEEEMLAAAGNVAAEWYVDPERARAFREILNREGKLADFISEVYRHKTRERLWVSECARLVRDPSGRTLFYECSVRDVTENVNRNRLEDEFRKLVAEVPGGLFQFTLFDDGSHRVPFLSEGIARITGYDYTEHQADPEIFNRCVHEEDRAAYDAALAESTRTLQPWDHEFRLRTRQGEQKWLRIQARPERVPGAVVWYGCVTDISVHKIHEIEIAELAYYDPLTRLPNRRMFLDQMVKAIARCGERGTVKGLIFIDLDNFKALNDTQGHDMGDDFLAEVAGRLRAAVGSSDLVARIGGDEFVILLGQGVAEAAQATLAAITVANRVLGCLREDFQLGELRHAGSASLGVVTFDGGDTRPDEVLKRADIAMYQAKAAGRNTVALFDPASLDREAERFRILADLRLALQRDELMLVLQPQIDHGGAVCGAEALLRWNHPTLGLVMPDQFIAVAEQFGLGFELAAFVFDRGMAQLREWQKTPATAGLRLALNVSAQCFADDDFTPMVTRLIVLHGIDPSRLTFELTEHVMAGDHAGIARRMAEIKALGIRLSLDDFGTGYSSLAYLKQLPLDELKIDGSFIADIEKAESDRALVETILAMARTLGLAAVAEHVENVRQEAFLRTFGCDYLQGYLYSRPVPADRFLEAIGDRATASAPASYPALKAG